jgi:Rps23 Pro-64 3,4-dihydroxylase Tpa1-like proline 4-hydroxylase
VTCVYYLTKDWQESMGGAFVDLEAPPAAAAAAAAADSSGEQGLQQGRVLVPRFNTAVFFRVPHYHMVTPLTTDRPR